MTTIIITRENPPLSADEVMTRARAAVARVDRKVGNRALTGKQRHDDEPSGPRNAAGGYGGAGAAGAGRSDFDDDIPF